MVGKSQKWCAETYPARCWSQADLFSASCTSVVSISVADETAAGATTEFDDGNLNVTVRVFSGGHDEFDFVGERGGDGSDNALDTDLVGAARHGKWTFRNCDDMPSNTSIISCRSCRSMARK